MEEDSKQTVSVWMDRMNDGLPGFIFHFSFGFPNCGVPVGVPFV